MFRILILCAMLVAAAPAAAVAQSPYDAVLSVNGAVITPYEIDQRARMLGAFGESGDLETQARTALIDDRLKMAAADKAGITVGDESIAAEMDAIIARGGTTMEGFLQILAQRGVAYDTFREFTKVNLSWRELIGSRFAQRVRIGDDEIDRALTLTSKGGLRVLMSELVLPVQPENRAEAEAFARDLQSSIHGQAEFERAVRRYSAASTREAGGRLDWIDLNQFPANVQQEILAMSPGQISSPIDLQGRAIVLFLLRGLGESPVSPPSIAALDYMLVRLPAQGGAERARAIAARVDICTDIYGQTDHLPEDHVQREIRAPADIPSRIRDELAFLDPGETSTRLTSADGSETWLLMLCGRSPEIPEGETREDIAQRLRAQRINALAEAYLSELRSAAQIEP